MYVRCGAVERHHHRHAGAIQRVGQQDQLRQRIGIHYRILPLSATESARYIHHRVAVAGGNAEELFPATTCDEIFRITNGIPFDVGVKHDA